MTDRILFVCLGNICRSPTAEAMFRRLAGDRYTIDSAGTAGWHVGKPPYGPMQDAAMARGVKMNDLRARQFTSQDFYDFDLILGMDDQNLQDINALRPKGNETPVQNIAHFGTLGHTHVPDPYYTRDFDQALDIIEDAAKGVIDQLQ